jgi:hypothetical protein
VTPKLKKKPAISNSKKRKSDEVSVVLESDNDTKKIRIAEGGMQDTVLWKNLKDQKQDELEEQLIARAFKKPSNTATNRAKVDTHPREFPTQQAAQAYCLSNPSQIADLSQPEAEMVGHLAKVFWDGEDTWFYARVLNFNAITGEYFIFYLEDSTGEWIDFNNEAAIVCKQFVLTRTSKSAMLWPAMTFHVFQKAKEVLKKYPAYNSTGEYVEFLHGDGRYEYSFVQPFLLEKFEEDIAMKKPNKRLQAAFDEATKAKNAVDEVIEAVQEAARKSVLAVRKKDQLIGTRVRAATSRILSRAERKMKPEERHNIVSAFCVGTITQYCQVKDMHLISFDDTHLQPQWVEILRAAGKKEVEILLSNGNNSRVSANSESIADAKANSLVPASNENLEETGADQLESCVLCKHECDHEIYGQDILHCVRCSTACHEHCLPAGELIPVNATARLKASQWLCWRCTDCYNCAATSWHTPLIYWSSKNQVTRQSDSRTLLLCGWCLKHYKHTKEYCVVCYKLYVYQQHQPGVIETSYASDMTMVQCHQCDRWVHAACEGIDKQQYESISDGTHPIWGDEYLCPLCRVQLCRDVMKRLFSSDPEGIFSMPVTEDIASNYFDIIHNPMDFSTMLEKVERGMYKSLQPLRQDAELVALNALIFNRSGDPIWRAAQQLFIKISELFLRLPRHSTRSAFGREAEQLIQARHMAQTGQLLALPAPSSNPSESIMETSVLSEAKHLTDIKQKAALLFQQPSVKTASLTEDGVGEEDGDSDRINPVTDSSEAEDSSDDSSEDEQDQIVPDAMPLMLSQLELEASPEPDCFLPARMNIITADEACVRCHQDCCCSCGTSSESQSFLYCCDCGEAVHFFCAGIDEVQFKRMDEQARHGWRCVNCKVCEICLVSYPTDAQTLLFCEQCDRSFHISCLHPTIPSLPDFAFVCGLCLKCEQCDSLQSLHKSHALVTANSPKIDSRQCWGNCTNLCVLCQDTISAASSCGATINDIKQLMYQLNGSPVSISESNESFPKSQRIIHSAVDEAKRFLTTWMISAATTHLYHLRYYGDQSKDLPNLLESKSKAASKTATKVAKGNKRAAVSATVPESKDVPADLSPTATVVVVESTAVANESSARDETVPESATSAEAIVVDGHSPKENEVTINNDNASVPVQVYISSKVDGDAEVESSNFENDALSEEMKRVRSCRARRFAALVRRRVHNSSCMGSLAEGQQLHVNMLSQIKYDGMEKISRLSAAFNSDDSVAALASSDNNNPTVKIASILEIIEASLALLQTALALYGTVEYPPESRSQMMAVYQRLDGWVRQNYSYLSVKIVETRKSKETMLMDMNQIFDDTGTLEIMQAMQAVARQVTIARIKSAPPQTDPAVDVTQRSMVTMSSIFPTAFQVLCGMTEIISKASLDQQPLLRRRKMLDCMIGVALDCSSVRTSLSADISDQAMQKLPRVQERMKEAIRSYSNGTGKDMLSFYSSGSVVKTIPIPLLRHSIHGNRIRKLSRFDLTVWRFRPVLTMNTISAPNSQLTETKPSYDSLTDTQKEYLSSLQEVHRATGDLLGQNPDATGDELVNSSEKFESLIQSLQEVFRDKLKITEHELSSVMDESPGALVCEENQAAFINVRCSLCGTGESECYSKPNNQWQQWEKEKGRLLPLGDSRWVHVNCLRWCEEVREDASGVLHNAVSAVDINLRVRCSLCSQPGASLLCLAQRRCRNAYHLTCARAMHCLLLQRRSPAGGLMRSMVTEDEEEEDSTGLCLLCPLHLDLCPTILPTPSRSQYGGRVRLETGIQQRFSKETYELWNPLGVNDRRRLLVQFEVDSPDSDAEANHNSSGSSKALVDSASGDCASSSNPTSQSKAKTSDANGTKDSNTKAETVEDLETEMQRRMSSLLVDRRLRGDYGVRMGALTIHRLGQLVVPGHPSESLLSDHVDPELLPSGLGFVTRHYLYPLHFAASRMFWSYLQLFGRTTYHCEVLCLDDLPKAIDSVIRQQSKDEEGNLFNGVEVNSRQSVYASIFRQLFETGSTSKPLDANEATSGGGSEAWDTESILQFDGPIFRITPADDPTHAIYATALATAFHRLQQRLQTAYVNGAVLTRGLTAHQFFGISVPVVRRALEHCPEAVSAMIAPEASSAFSSAGPAATEATAAAAAAAAVVPTKDKNESTAASSLHVAIAQRYRPSYRLPGHAEVLRLERRRRRQQAQQQAQMFSQRRRRHLCSRAQSLRPPSSSHSAGAGSAKLRTKVADVDDNEHSDDEDDAVSVATAVSKDKQKSVAAASSSSSSSSGGPPSRMTSKKSKKKRGWNEGDNESDNDEDVGNADDDEDDDEDEELDAERRARQREEEDLEKEAQVDDRRRRYLQMRQQFEADPNQRLRVRRSGIHGWGLFSRVALDRDAVIVEYVGEQIRQAVADRREVLYEEEGVGSCYLFRLDKEVIVDATRSGGMARFINHSCDPNAYARIISANTKAPSLSSGNIHHVGGASNHKQLQDAVGKRDEEEKHIVIMALREIQPGEEITYDYKFPIEDKKLQCFCGSARCSGAMN